MSVIDLIKLICLDGYELTFINMDGHKIVDYIQFSKEGVWIRFEGGGRYNLPEELVLVIDKANTHMINGYVHEEDVGFDLPSFYLKLQKVSPADIKELLESI
jgi:hypothetical protein